MPAAEYFCPFLPGLSYLQSGGDHGTPPAPSRGGYETGMRRAHKTHSRALGLTSQPRRVGGPCCVYKPQGPRPFLLLTEAPTLVHRARSGQGPLHPAVSRLVCPPPLGPGGARHASPAGPEGRGPGAPGRSRAASSGSTAQHLFRGYTCLLARLGSGAFMLDPHFPCLKLEDIIIQRKRRRMLGAHGVSLPHAVRTVISVLQMTTPRLREMKSVAPKHTASSNFHPYPLGDTPSKRWPGGGVFSPYKLMESHGTIRVVIWGQRASSRTGERGYHTRQGEQGILRNAVAARWEAPREARSTLAIFFSISRD